MCLKLYIESCQKSLEWRPCMKIINLMVENIWEVGNKLNTEIHLALAKRQLVNPWHKALYNLKKAKNSIIKLWIKSFTGQSAPWSPSNFTLYDIKWFKYSWSTENLKPWSGCLLISLFLKFIWFKNGSRLTTETFYSGP